MKVTTGGSKTIWHQLNSFIVRKSFFWDTFQQSTCLKLRLCIYYFGIPKSFKKVILVKFE